LNWEWARRKHKKHILPLVTHEEWKHVSLSHRYRKGEKGMKLLVATENGKISSPSSLRGLYLYSPYGILYPKIEQISPPELSRAGQLLTEITHNLFSVMGLKSEVTDTCRLIEKQPHTIVDYYLMVLFRKDYKEESLNEEDKENQKGISIKRARPGDTKNLFPLQEAYELEEVVLDKRNYNPKFSFANFRKSISNNIILYAELNGKPVAKAGTNARGFNTDQVGGVFTVKEERGRGLGRIVMKNLLFCIFKEKEAASLFVKKNNIPAIRLYERLGFEIIDEYRIAYF